ncbi:MAG: putative transrane protein [Alphaproteobacteria bacterium]|nr:putative transrane protein [Alphaproteobacteria bacterium]MDB5741010.1 putative transrane protein [Alphaproteobacteria bacterium]
MKIRTFVLGALVGAGALAATAGTASAYVACNRAGDCWHTTDRYDYRPAFGVRVHDDNWRWGHRDRYRWREHQGRGYWRSGVWVTF